MSQFRIRSLAVALSSASLLGFGALAAPAQAGGPGQHYVYGSSQAQCNANLAAAVRLYRSNDYIVTGVNACRRTGDSSTWVGDLVANPA